MVSATRAVRERTRYACDDTYREKRCAVARDHYQQHAFEVRRRVYLRLLAKGMIVKPRKVEVYNIEPWEYEALYKDE